MSDPAATGKDLNAHPVVQRLKRSMQTKGINLDDHISEITNVYEVPKGFGFRCKDEASCTRLRDALMTNSNFAADTPLGGKLHSGVSWREVTKLASLHVSLHKVVVNKELVAGGDIHLDSVSVVAGRDESGKAIYDPGPWLQHMVADGPPHAPWLIVPTADGGIRLGLRF
jgi:hypothetical protein